MKCKFCKEEQDKKWIDHLNKHGIQDIVACRDCLLLALVKIVNSLRKKSLTAKK